MRDTVEPQKSSIAPSGARPAKKRRIREQTKSENHATAEFGATQRSKRRKMPRLLVQKAVPQLEKQAPELRRRYTKNG